MDVVASLYGRNSLHDIISETAKNNFIPITVGGGIRSVKDIKNILRAGADKVCLNTAAIKNPEFIKKASREFGSSTILVSIEAIKDNDKYQAFTDNGREYTGLDVFEWAQRIDELGAGELVITSVDKEGTGKGFDIELISKINNLVSIPVIAHGGAGKKEDVIDLVKSSTVNSVMISSMFHYNYINDNESSGSSLEGNTQFLKNKWISNKLNPCSILDLKNELNKSNISCR